MYLVGPCQKKNSTELQCFIVADMFVLVLHMYVNPVGEANMPNVSPAEEYLGYDTKLHPVVRLQFWTARKYGAIPSMLLHPSLRSCTLPMNINEYVLFLINTLDTIEKFVFGWTM